MEQPNFFDAALIIVGHGTSVDPDSGVPVYQHAAELRRRHIFGEVREGFWKQEPKVVKVVSELRHQRIFIAPFFISEGYFGEQVIPEALGFAREARTKGRGVEAPNMCRRLEREGQTLFYCEPVGTHVTVTHVLVERARAVIEQFPFPRVPAMNSVALFLAAHGTQKNENSRESAERQAELIRRQHLFASVHAVFMEEDPRITTFHKMTSGRNVVVVPFFVSEGPHVKHDIPVLLGVPERVVRERLTNGQPPWRNPTEVKGKLVWYSRAAGTHPSMADAVVERVKEAANSVRGSGEC